MTHCPCSLSDDLDIAPDFFEYFLATFPLLHSDPLLWCVSAWNDNGKSALVSNEAGQWSPPFVVCLFHCLTSS